MHTYVSNLFLSSGTSKVCPSSPTPSLASMEPASFRTVKRLRLFSWKGTFGLALSHFFNREYVPECLDQMDFLRFISTWSPSMACPCNATVTHSGSGCRNWPFHRVIVIISLHTFSLTDPSSVS